MRLSRFDAVCLCGAAAAESVRAIHHYCTAQMYSCPCLACLMPKKVGLTSELFTYTQFIIAVYKYSYRYASVYGVLGRTH